MTYDYTIPVYAPTGQSVMDVAVEIQTAAFEYGTDTDGRRGERREEIEAITITDLRTLPRWAREQAIDRARNRWLEGR